jgi:hypothetical protein
MTKIYRSLSKKAIIAFLKVTVATLCIVLMALFTAASCEKPKDVPTGTTTSLAGIKWKLIEFVQISEGTIKIPEPQSDQCYWIFFDSDTSLYGKTSTNDIWGQYRINPSTSTIYINNLGGTEINELFDGRLYLERMLSICSFEATKTSLKLYYNETDYLLFNLYNHENK